MTSSNIEPFFPATMQSRWGNGSMAALMAGRHDGWVGFRLTREDLLQAVRESSGRRKPPSRSRASADVAPALGLHAGTTEEQPGNLLPEDWEVFGCLAALREDADADDTTACDDLKTPARPAYAAEPIRAIASTGGAPHGPRPSSAPAWKQPALSPPLRPGEEEPWYERLANAPRQKSKPKRRTAAAVPAPMEPGRSSSKELRLRPRSALACSYQVRPSTPAGPLPAAKPRQRRASADGPEPPIASRRLPQHTSAAASLQQSSSRWSRSESPSERTRRAHSAGVPRHSVAPREIDLPAAGGGLDGGARVGQAECVGSGRNSLEGELDRALRELIARTGEESPELPLHTLQHISTRERASAGAAEPPGQRGAAGAHGASESAVDRALSELARHSGDRAHQLLLRSIGRICAPDAVPAATAPSAGETQLRVAPPHPRPRSALGVNNRMPPRHGQPIQWVEKPVLYGEVVYPRRRSAAALSAECLPRLRSD